MFFRSGGGLIGLLVIAVLCAFGVSSFTPKMSPVPSAPQKVLVKPVPHAVPTTPRPDAMPRPVVAVEIVEFYSTFCIACKRIDPVITSIQAKGIRVQRINADDEPAKAKQFGVTATPTIIIYRNGKEVDRIVGDITEPALLAKIADAQLRFFLSAPEVPKVSKPAKVETPERGENGWWLRVFYPPGEGREVLDLFENNPEFSAFGQLYAYRAIPTTDPSFEPWRKAGYATNKVTVVLVNSNDRVVLRTTNVSDPDRLMNHLAEAAKKPFWMHAELVEP